MLETFYRNVYKFTVTYFAFLFVVSLSWYFTWHVINAYILLLLLHTVTDVIVVVSYQQLACQHWDDASRSGTLKPTVKQEYEVDIEEDEGEGEDTNKAEDTEKVRHFYPV